jgi:hypothetical protein
MNRLKGMTAYLCGAMDRVADGGVVCSLHSTPPSATLSIAPHKYAVIPFNLFIAPPYYTQLSVRLLQCGFN